MSEPTLYEQVVARGGLAPPAAKVRASAAVVLWRRRDAGDTEVYWMRRDPAMKFMGGWYAFPGGSVSRRDVAVESEAEPPSWLTGTPRGLDAEVATGSMPPTLTAGLDPLPPDRAPGLVTATLRELFEETGLLPTAGGGWASGAATARLAAARRDLLAKHTELGEILAGEGLILDASRLLFAGRWLTPPFAPMRFDNRYFLLEHGAGAPEPADSEEAVSAGWIRPSEALERWERGEVMAAPPIVHLLRVLADEAAEATGASPEAVGENGLRRLRHPEEANLGPLRNVELRPGLILFPLRTPTLPPASHTNCYLLGTGEAVLVDPGTPDPEEAERLAAALDAAHSRLGRRVTAIWLTHHHPDHVGAVELLRRRLGVPVAAHEATAERLSGRGITVDARLADGDRVELAGAGGRPMTVRVLHTPGHARGHLCFFEEGLGSLLAGDMVSAVSTIVIDPPEGDMDAYLASLERLARLAPRTLFPGHGPPVTDPVGKLRELIDHRLWREEKVLEAWRAGTRAPREMLPAVYDDAPRQAWPLAERQIEAHLRRLARAGAIDDPARSSAAP